MSSKDNPLIPSSTPISSSSPAQIVPVDLATNKPMAPSVAQIRIPTVSSTMKPSLITTNRPGPGPSPGIRPQSNVITKPVGASITMIPPGKVVVPATVGQLISAAVARTTSSTSPPTSIVKTSIATRPILAQPAPARPSSITPLRGVTPVHSAVAGHGHALTLRAPIQPALPGNIRLASPGSVHLIQTTQSGSVSGAKVTLAGPPRPVTVSSVSTGALPRAGAVLPVAGARAPMAAVSYRPGGPLVTTARPTLSPTGATAVTLIQTTGTVTKTIVTQNPAGVFKPITTQVSVTGAPVALKPSPVVGSSPIVGSVRVPAGQRVTVVSQPLAVSLTQAPTHIQVPMVPGATGPPKTRVAVPSANMKLVAGSTISAVSLAPVQISQTPAGARTIQLPNSGTKSGSSVSTNIPVARVPPQQHGAHGALSVTSGYVTFVPANSRESASGQQASPVNLTVTRAVVAPAMTIPNFSQSTLMYDRPGDGQTKPNQSVTITTLPPPGEGPASIGNLPPAPATITPARITPIIPAAQDSEKLIPGSPRPSILRKRPDSDALTPVKSVQGVQGAAILASPSSPPRPESSGSSTISATSSLPGLSGDEQPAPPPVPSIEPSPRKKPRKQQLPPRETNPNVSPEWASVKREIGVRDRLDWNTRPEADWEGKVRNWNNTWTAGAGEQIADLNSWDGDMVQDQADDEDEMSTDEEERKQLGSLIRGKPQVSLLNSYRHTWKSRHNHFLRYSDVKSKDERRPTVNELANQKLVLQKINGWKIYHLSAGMEDVVDMENELSDRLEDFAQRLEDAASKDVEKELLKVQELIKANIQRSKVIQDQVSEAKDNCQSIFEHKPKIQDIILKYQSKRDRTSKGRRDN